jgi:hypothetical protein
LKTFVLSIMLFCLFYFTMKYLKAAWEKRQLPAWSKHFTGIFAWGVLVAFIGILWGLVQPIIDLFTAPSMGIGIQLCAYTFIVSILLKYAHANPELFEVAAMLPFLRDALVFSNPGRSRMLLAEEMEKHKVRQIYKDTTGKDLRIEGDQWDASLKKKLLAVKKNEAYAQDTRVAPSKESLSVLQQPIQSILAKEELKQLRHGILVDISDTWQLNRLKKASHHYFHMVKKVTVDPVSRQVTIVLESEQFTDARIQDPASLYRLKQDLYDFLQGVHQQDWVQPYLQFATTISCTCCHVEDLVFGDILVHPVCCVEISRDVLKANENIPYDAGKLPVEVLV